MKVVRHSTKRAAVCGASLFTILLAAGQAQAQELGPDEDVVAVDEIVVTGTSIRGVPPVGSNLIGVSRADVERLGAANTPDILASVPQLNSFNTAPVAASGGFGTFAPGMRGLPSSATLPLMNGHRLVAAAANDTAPDYPLIPALAIERVEVVADGASSIYGSDAVTGVVNFITRRRVDGVEASANYGVGDAYYQGHFGVLAGKTFERGSALIAYQYTQNDSITGADRGYRTQDFTKEGGLDARAINCPSPNVLYDTSFYAVYHAAPDLIPGTTNYCDNGAVVDLYPSTELHSLFASGEYQVSDKIRLWGEALYADRHDEMRVGLPVQSVAMSAANPFFQGPAGGAANVAYVLFRPDNIVGADHFINQDDKQVFNGSVGVDFQLPREFELTLGGTFGWTDNDAYIPAINTAAITAAGFGATTATALDPFGDGTSEAVKQAILADAATAVGVTQTMDMASARLSGPLFELPGGTMKIALGAEYRKETFEQRGVVGASPVPEELDRDISSFYGEIFAPLVSEANALPLVRKLSLSLSGRYDKYSDFGETSNPKVGLNWTPADGLDLRASYGQSFRAPGMRQIGATVGAYYLDAASSVVGANDPTRGPNQVATIYLLGGNKNLQPEEAETWSLGADWTPSFAPNFKASVTYYNIEYFNTIGVPSAAMVFTDPTFSKVIHRDPTPSELQALLAGHVNVNVPSAIPAAVNFLDLRLNNFGMRSTDGLDMFFRYNWPTDFGLVYADLSANYILNYDVKQTPNSAVADSLDLGIPQTTARFTLGADVGAWSVASFVNFRGEYTNNYATPTGVAQYTSSPYVTFDLRVSWTLPDRGWSQGMTASLQVNDLLDETPPYFPATDGIGGAYNPIGRFVALNLRKTF